MSGGRQMSLEMFGKRKNENAVVDVDVGHIEKKPHLNEITENHVTIEDDETEEMVDQMIMDLATESDEPEETEEMVDQMIMDLATESDDGGKMTPEQRKAMREAEKEKKRLKKIEDEEKKREMKRVKKQEEDAKKKLKKEKEEEEKRIKKEKIEAERKMKQEAKEQERIDRLRKREEDAAAREEKKRIEREEKERERLEKEKEKERLEKEKEIAKKLEEEKLKKRSIMNFFKVKTEEETQPDANKIEDTKVDTDFNQYFLPFHVGPNITLHTTKLGISSKWNDLASQKYTPEPPIESSAKKPINRASEVLQCLNLGSINEAKGKFQNVPLKYLKFYENRKPAYFGTFSYTYDDIEDNVNLALNPCEKIKLKSEAVVIDYDYYSDINEEDEEGEEGEGEDLNSDDEDDEDDDGDGGSSDIEEFLDENDSKNSTTSKVIGPLVAVVRHFEQTFDDENDEFGDYFKTLKWEPASDTLKFPIDPFKDYWTPEKPKIIEQQAAAIFSTPVKQQNLLMGIITTSGSSPNPVTPTSAGIIGATTNAQPLTVKRRTIPSGEARESLRAFITEHSHLSLPTLCEVAVKGSGPGPGSAGGQFSQWSKAVVKNTVKEEAVWSKKSGWVLIDRPAGGDTSEHVTEPVSVVPVMSV